MISSVKFVVGENITLKCYLEGRNVGYLKMIKIIRWVNADVIPELFSMAHCGYRTLPK